MHTPEMESLQRPAESYSRKYKQTGRRTSISTPMADALTTFQSHDPEIRFPLPPAAMTVIEMGLRDISNGRKQMRAPRRSAPRIRGTRTVIV